MPLYQKSVLNKYLKQQDKAAVSKAYNKFTKYFHDSNIQANIRASKEEEYQGIFLTELFVNILGYTMKPNANYNLVAEFKNEKNSKKADGAILKNDNAIGVIELKGTNTKDLEHIRQQAFDYKANQTGCVYVITSNFEKIRFYINNAVDFEEFDLFTLSLERFELLNLCLSFENIHGNIPLKIKEDSLQEEEKITKKFYSDYSLFKRELFRDLVKLNLKNEVFRNELNKEDADRANKNIKQALFQKSQKLIDRFLFIFFAEDRELLPPNSTKQILNKWKSDVDFGDNRPIYDLFKLYFNYLDTGRKGTDSRAEIFAYNGGLFKSDTILDSLLISNELLFKHCDILQSYDFDSQVDVNILGHIFENSLNEIESVNAEIEGAEFDKQTTKRKKDGVFYTPKYITKYIVDNTVGKLCEDKKAELKINALDTTKNYRIKDKRTIEQNIEFKTGTGVVKSVKNIKTNLSVEGEKILNQIEAYRAWLLKITICDPACGSGAFLNQALNFLIAEHGFIDELLTAVQGKAMVFPNIENTVLENNIFGVDINEESVEIAKLSLWLRTAQPRRKLNDLSSNIKCGNSLIDDKKVAGDKAFTWKEEFAHVFEKGGFDIVIGNPPYVAARNMKEVERIYLSKKYEDLQGAWDLYVPFLLLGEDISNNNCYGWIIPNKLLISDYAIKSLERLKNNGLNKVINISSLPIFKNVGVYPIILINNNENSNFHEYEIKDIENLENIEDYIKLPNIFKRFQTIKNFDIKINSGTTGFEAKKIKPLINENKIGYKFAVSGSIDPYLIDRSRVPYMKSVYKYPNIELNMDILAESKIQFWKTPKIVIAGMTKRIEAYYSEEPLALGVGVYGIYDFSNFNPFFLLGVLNSKFLTYYLNIEFHDKHLAGGYLAINKSTLEYLPIIRTSEDNELLIANITRVIIEKKNLFLQLTAKFQTYLQSQFPLEKPTKKLQNWHELEFGEFIKELNKAIKTIGGVPLTKIQEMEWMEVFETKKAEAQALKTQIEQTDKEIDQMVYKLYELKDEEIAIVESS